jgi:hypothetical protein
MVQKLDGLKGSVDGLRPAYYRKGIECLEYIESHEMGFAAGNVIKYVTRYLHKDGVADLKKAREYLDRMIKRLEGQGQQDNKMRAP